MSRTPKIPMTYRVVAEILRAVMRLFLKRDWRGVENLPREGGYVVAPNHISHLDPLVFAHLLYDSGHPPFFLGKEAMFRVPVVGWVLRHADQVPVYRESSRAQDAFRAAVAAVREGKTVAIYPEGTLTRDPDLWPMVGKTGAARVALTTRCPLIPIAQWGPQEVLPPYGKRIHLFPRRTMQLRVGPAVDLSDLYDRPLDRATLTEATDRLLDAITGLLAQIRGEQPPAVRFDPRLHGMPLTGNFKKRRPTATGKEQR